MNKTIVERPENTLSQAYLANRDQIYRWRKKNPEKVAEYNREYQRKLRKDPVAYEEMLARTALRTYLLGTFGNSYKVISRLGMNREQLAAREGFTDLGEFKKFLKAYEVDHILPSSYFNLEENAHLKPFRYRAYNIQFVPRYTNRHKHKWVDDKDPRVLLVRKKMEMEYIAHKVVTCSEDMVFVHKLAKDIKKLEKTLKIRK